MVTVLTTGSDNTESEGGAGATGVAVTVTNTGVTVTTIIDNPEGPGPGKADVTNVLGVAKESGTSEALESDAARVLMAATSERSRTEMRKAGIMAMLVDRSVLRIRDGVEQWNSCVNICRERAKTGYMPFEDFGGEAQFRGDMLLNLFSSKAADHYTDLNLRMVNLCLVSSNAEKY